MKLYCCLLQIGCVGLIFAPITVVQATELQLKDNEAKQGLINSLLHSQSNIRRVSEVKPLHTNAQLLAQSTENLRFELGQFHRFSDPAIASAINQVAQLEPSDEPSIEIDVEAEREIPQTSSPVYEVTEEDIEKQKPNSLAELLRNLPGFAINDAGFGADIHTGTYYRGSSINQSVYLLNGRPINSNVNTYHGATDLNSIPVESIERVELSSGTSSTLYGSEAFGGVVNIITKQGTEIPRLNGLVEYGSYDQSNYRASYGGAAGSLRYSLGYEEYSADNRYRVPEGAANRDAEGRLFNGDTATSNYFGSLGFDLELIPKAKIK